MEANFLLWALTAKILPGKGNIPVTFIITKNIQINVNQLALCYILSRQL